jgi:predicted LPLAT superfamily acyltransferase
VNDVEITALEAPPKGWLEVAEKGSVLGIKFFVWMVSFFGRTAAHSFLAVVIFYYVLFHRGMRTSSRKYLARLGKPHGFWDAYRHSLRFGQCIVDRIFFVRGKTDVFEVDRTGHEHLRKLHEEKRGAILLGAHVGSFQAMRAFAEEKSFRINVLVNNANAQMINRVLVGLNPKTQVRMLEVSAGLDFIFKVRERIEAGEMVAVMGDRVGPDGREAEVDFLGSKARFPTGAYQLAASLGCPIYLTLGIFRGGNRYSLFCEPFAETVKLPRKGRQEALAEHAQRYASRLEQYCREAPENWFNFYDFWEEK